MKRKVITALTIGVLLVSAGCQRLSGGPKYAAPLPATPTTPVGQGELQPLDQSVPAPGTTLDGTGQGTDVASVAEPAGALNIGRSDMLGGWKLSSAGDNCMAFMTLTTWSGGYRANTRGCSSPALANVSAWDLSGKQVVLKDSSGAPVAQLYATSAQQFNGQTSSGSPVSLFR
ncbi:protease inhibitor Inh/omp19 family protein [Roseibium sp. RKSG952]|uniref:protease inhibitor Inh/omp19 family protein n=1 Tax=Roseibium sp. RKSG952 TaxID=2529384 RepID=UPI0012BD15BB|nr:protease inhibitor Inh/omp19 family protein [Roseibium sp. RKSG952]MTI00247.1 hypothetical protein [Roseibium sp. RKSG952]